MKKAPNFPERGFNLNHILMKRPIGYWTEQRYKFMAKNILICVLFLAFVAALVFAFITSSRNDSITRGSVEAIKQRDEARVAEYRAQEALKLTRDTLELAYQVAVNAKRDAAIAHLETQKAKEELKKVVFRSLKTDKERDSVLRALYPSLN